MFPNENQRVAQAGRLKLLLLLARQRGGAWIQVSVMAQAALVADKGEGFMYSALRAHAGRSYMTATCNDALSENDRAGAYADWVVYKDAIDILRGWVDA